MAGGKREGSGRKPTGKVPMLVRVAPETRARLEREAKRERQSLSAIAERHLTDALRGQPIDSQTRALCYLITRIPMVARTFARAAPLEEFSWRTNRFDFEVLKHVVNEVLDRLAPTGTVESGRYGGLNDYLARAGFERVGSGEIPHVDEDSPIGLGEVITATLLGALAAPNLLYAEGERIEAPRGSAYYAMPQAARDLGLTGEDK